MFRFPSYIQHDAKDCGPTCLRILAKYYGKNVSQESMRNMFSISSEGVSLYSISNVASSIGFNNEAFAFSFDELKNEFDSPCIVFWKKSHFIVVYKIKRNKVYVSDPSCGRLTYSKEEFCNQWYSIEDVSGYKGVVLFIKPNEDFYDKLEDMTRTSMLKFLYTYFKPYKKLLIHLVAGLFIGSFIQLILPFLTQAIVDIGISDGNIGFIYLILIAQLVLLISRMSVDFVRRWFLLHISTRVNLSLVSDFFIKLMSLPMHFFSSRQIGDLIQRIEDYDRIHRFLTSQTLNVIFVSFNLLVFGIVLYIYNLNVFFIFTGGSFIYGVWVLSFLRKRRTIDYRLFEHRSSSKNKTLQLLYGIEEIKLQGCKVDKRWEWEDSQAELFKVNISSLTLEQIQEAGSLFINELRNIIIIIATASAVIQGQLTLGMMLSIQYIVGQLNSPIIQIINFIHYLQDVRISLERVNEVQQREDENTGRIKRKNLQPCEVIRINDVSFQYDASPSSFALKNVSLEIPKGKVTAIVGASGSGKTTLIKLILGHYRTTEGQILIGNENINNICLDWWRNQCGAVLQNGYIFSDTIAGNISVSSSSLEIDKLNKAIEMTNLQEFVDKLPLSYNTMIGQDGRGISEGQKQRVFMARVIYKDSPYIFLDEATNSLDAKNEKAIVENLKEFYIDKTVIIVAHRLNTVKNADQIIVLENGTVAELGIHNELIKKRGKYYSLVKNQLELGR